MKQQARELTNFEDGFLKDKEYIIMDRDGAFCPAFPEMLSQAGVEPVVSPPQSPNMNAYMERYFRSLKPESLDRIIPFGEQSVRRTVHSYIDHYHQ